MGKSAGFVSEGLGSTILLAVVLHDNDAEIQNLILLLGLRLKTNTSALG